MLDSGRGDVERFWLRRMRASALPPAAPSATLPPDPFPKLIVGDTSGAIGYNTGVMRRQRHKSAGLLASR